MSGIARDRGLSEVYLNAQTSAEGFYRPFGFRAVGDEFLDADIPHIRMEMTLD